MPRKSRMYLPHIPCHVISRGNNRDACFYADDDYFFYLDCLHEACAKYDVSVHAYVLMTNHVHFLLKPSDSLGISRVMQSIGRRYVQYVNYAYRRSGTLWEGRHKSSLVDSDNYILACYRYIELNPIRAGMIVSPADYRWSSYRVNAGLRPRKQLIAHDTYLGLGRTDEARHMAYRDLFSSELSAELLRDIRRAGAFSMPLGDNRFKQQIEQAIGRKIGHIKVGRPKELVENQ